MGNGLQEGLEIINREIIRVDYEDRLEVVNQIIVLLIDMMCEISPVFNKLFINFWVVGSVNDRLKIDMPDEFDVNLGLEIPNKFGPVLKLSDKPGYIHLYLRNFCYNNSNSEIFRTFKLFVDNRGYMLTDKFREAFFQSLFDKVLNELETNTINIDGNNYTIISQQGLGPARTLTLRAPNNDQFSIDLVPTILMHTKDWPNGKFKRNPYPHKKNFNSDLFFAVPKNPKNDNLFNKNRYFRLSFHFQEKYMMYNEGFLKPTIKLLKLTRDIYCPDISSYAIKTICLREWERTDFSRCSLSFWFVYMLKRFEKCLENKNIPYLWIEGLNLIEDLNESQLVHYKNQIQEFLAALKREPTKVTILDFLYYD